MISKIVITCEKPRIGTIELINDSRSEDVVQVKIGEAIAIVQRTELIDALMRLGPPAHGMMAYADPGIGIRPR